MPTPLLRSRPIARAACTVLSCVSACLPLLAAVGLAPRALAQGLSLREVVLDLKTYTSPSRQMSIKIDPSSRGGAGGATYTLTKSGVQVWSAKLPVTLWEAAIADDGTVAGYAYPEGYPFSYCTGQPEVPIAAVIIDPTGALRLGDPKAAGEGDADHTGIFKATFGGGVILDTANDRLTIRTVTGGWADGTQWRTYQLSTGKFLGTIAPAEMVVKGQEQAFVKDIAVELVPGTPLVLVHRYGYRNNFPSQASDGDAGFALLNPEGKAVWSLDIEHEYTDLGERFRWSDLVGEPAFQIATRPLGFDIISYKQGRVSFAIEADGEAWKIRETGRSAEKLPPGGADERPKPALAGPTTFELKPLGQFTLGGNDPEPAIRGIWNFNIDAKGRIGWIRKEAPDKSQLVLVDLSGTTVAEVPLPPVKGKVPFQKAIPLAPDRWLVLTRGVSRAFADFGPFPVEAWTINPDTGVATPLEEFKLAEIQDAVPSGDGGFVAITGDVLSRTVMSFDAAGHERWRGRNADDLCVTSKGLVAMLYHVGKDVRFLSAAGEPLREVELKNALHTTPNYPSGIYPDVNGGVILHDFQGSPDVYRLSAEDTVVASFHPHTADGNSFNYMGGFHLDPENHIWTSDGHRFLRLDSQGVVDRTLGESLDSPRLGNIDTITMDAQGLMYALDRASKSLHVLDGQGRTIRICRPNPGDFEQIMLGDIAIAPDHSIFCGGGLFSDKGVHYVHFSADGTRLGTHAPDFDTVSEKTRFLPDGSRLAIGYHEIRIIAPDGTLKARIDHRPDGKWLGRGSTATVGADGTIVVISGGGLFGSGEPPQTCIYDPAGNPVGSFTSSGISGDMAFSLVGPWLVGSDGTGVSVQDIRTGEERTAPLAIPEGGQSWYTTMVTPPDPATGQREIWIRRAGERTVQRYAFPQ